MRYWSKVLLELDTETNRVRIMKQFAQPEAGSGYKKPKKLNVKSKQLEEVHTI